VNESLSKLSESLGLSDDIPRTLQDQLGVKETSELSQYSLRTLGSMFPELDRGSLYDFGQAAQLPEFTTSHEVAPATEGESFHAQAGDGFQNDAILKTLPRFDSQIDQQGRNGCCSAFATTSLLEFCLARAGRPGIRLSRAFMYIVGNDHEGQNLPWWSLGGLIPGNDWGVWPDSLGRVIQSYGFLLNPELPYDPNHDYYDANANPVSLKQHPNPVFQRTSNHVQRARANIPGAKLQISPLYPLVPWDSVTGKIDAYLRAGYPSVYAFKTPSNVGEADGTAIMPRRDGDNGKGHSVLIIGKMTQWSPGPGHPTTNWYIYRNSWDTNFGRNHPLAQYRGQGCGVISEHDVYWRHIQSLHMSWK
jgi:hypothetical protein